MLFIEIPENENNTNISVDNYVKKSFHVQICTNMINNKSISSTFNSKYN